PGGGDAPLAVVQPDRIRGGARAAPRGAGDPGRPPLLPHQQPSLDLRAGDRRHRRADDPPPCGGGAPRVSALALATAALLGALALGVHLLDRRLEDPASPRPGPEGARWAKPRELSSLVVPAPSP